MAHGTGAPATAADQKSWQHLDGLAALASSLEGLLQRALEALVDCDEDLAHFLDKRILAMRELMRRASDVLIASSLSSIVLAGLRTRPNSGRMRSADKLLSKLRRDIDAVANDYVELAEHINYVTDCVELSYDTATLCTDDKSSSKAVDLHSALSSLRPAADMLNTPAASFEVIFAAGSRISRALDSAQKMQRTQVDDEAAGAGVDKQQLLPACPVAIASCLDQLFAS